MKKDSADSLRKLIGIFNENEMALSALGIDTKSCDFVWVHILSEKLDSETAREWQLSNAYGKLQSMEQLRKFLERRARALGASGRSLETTRELTREKRAERETCQSYQSNSMSCPVCKKAHRIYACPAFLSLSLNERHQRIKELRLCFNCLKEGHSIKSCSSKKLCQTCNKKHNTLLHRIDTASVHFTENEHTTNDDPQFTGHQQESSYTTVLPTAIVSVIDSQKLVQCRALLDSGSQLSFITEKLVNALNLNKDDVNLNLWYRRQGKRC